MIEDEKLRESICSIMKIGSDVVVYVKLQAFINDLGDSKLEEEFKTSIHRFAWLINELEKE